MLNANPAGLANAYDAYAGKLHAYCWSLLHDHDAAADAVQDTFIVADKCIGQLRDPDRLRPWLYAIARNESLRQLRASARSAPFEEAGDVIDESAGDVGRGLDQEQTRALVWAAAKGLNPGEYEVLELNLRHELEGADLADALGVSRNHAHALLSRARAQFEISLAALLVARTGRGSCEALDALLTGWDGGITALLRKRINRHIEQCEVCGERKKRELRPAMLMSALPFFLAPAGLRDHVLRLVADPSAAAYRQMVVNRAGPFGSNGFVKPLQHPGASGGRNNQRNNNQNNQGGNQGGQGGQGGAGPPSPGVGATALLPAGFPGPAPDFDPGHKGGAPRDRRRKIPKSSVLLALLILLTLGGITWLSLPTTPAATTNALPTPPAATAVTQVTPATAPAVVIVTASPTASPTPTPTPTPSAVQTTAPAVTHTVRATPTPSRTPTPPPTTPPPPAGTLTANPTTVYFPYATSPTGSFTVSETGGTLAGVTVDNPDPTGLQYTVGRIVRNTVEIELSSPEEYSNSVTLTIHATNASSITVTVVWPSRIQ